MSSTSPELHGLAGPNQLFSPADFLDADDLRPTSAVFDTIGNGNPTQYTTAVNGVLSKHIDEIKQKVSTTILMPAGWKRKLREFMGQKNTELLDFLKLSVASHATISKGDLIMKRFGLMTSSFSNVREYVLDISGADVIKEISAELGAIRTDDGLKDYLHATRFLFDQYREAGEEALKHEQILRAKLDIFDKIQSRISNILDIDHNDAYDPLLKATETYIQSIFDKNAIQGAYMAFIAAYRRFISLRDVVLMSRTIHSYENEPLCTICLKEQVSYTISPCGHTYCTLCSRRQTASCFICRGVIRDKVKIFFS